MCQDPPCRPGGAVALQGPLPCRPSRSVALSTPDEESGLSSNRNRPAVTGNNLTLRRPRHRPHRRDSGEGSEADSRTLDATPFDALDVDAVREEAL